MPTRGQYLQSERVHKWQLVALFVAWKCLLLVIASCSPGPGYDTSSLILSNPNRHRHTELAGWSWADRIAINHFRWDSLYFVKTAQRGYVHEQEWAFSWVYSAVVRTAVKSLSPNPEPPLLQYVWAGIAVSNISHFVSMLILFKLVNVLLGESRGARTSFIACALYVISPAGIFLSAPYGEALFAALNLGGMLCYVQARAVAHSNKSWTFRQDAEVVSSALLFGLATWIRGNGLLSGLIFLFDVASAAPRIVRMQSGSSDLRRVTVTLVAGVLLGIMAIIPQYIAYNDYCNGVDDSETRPWCYKTIPSIYTWVQSEYWNVGFLRYWTLPNLPLFLMAAPMLWLLFQSSVTYLRASTQQTPATTPDSLASTKRISKLSDTDTLRLPQLALPQLALAIAAATSFHVQIINRLSSGYPIWYLSVAEWMTPGKVFLGADDTGAKTQAIVRGMILYSIVQGVLYAGFLPPA